MSATPTRQKKTLWLYGIIALLLIITVGTLISAQNIKTTAQKDAEAAPPDPSTITATVTREKLRTTVPPDLHRELRHLNPATLQRGRAVHRNHHQTR